jgi:5'-nucleotidase
MHILVTNDDGVYAPGLLALAKALRRVGDVTVIAPHDNQSAIGHRKTLHKPLRVWSVQLADDSPALATSGSPSDCVALAMLGLVERKVDVVVSGINDTWNLGQDVTYSGTVTAAMEGVLFDLPAISISAYYDGTPRYSVAADFAARLAVEVDKRSLPRHTLLSVNVPDLPQEDIAGVMVTRQGTRIYPDRLIVRDDPRGRPYYWIGGDPPSGLEEEEGTDFWALSKGYISVTPLHMDLTAHTFAEELRGWELSVDTALEG